MLCQLPSTSNFACWKCLPSWLSTSFPWTTRHDLVVNEMFLLVIDVLSLAFVWPSQLRGHSRSRIYPGIITAWPVILCWQGFSSTVHSQASEGSKIALLGSFPRPNVKITCASDMSKNWLPVSSNMLHWCSRYCLALCLICFSCVFRPVLLHHSADAPRFCIPKWKKRIHRQCSFCCVSAMSLGIHCLSQPTKLKHSPSSEPLLVFDYLNYRLQYARLNGVLSSVLYKNWCTSRHSFSTLSVSVICSLIMFGSVC